MKDDPLHYASYGRLRDAQRLCGVVDATPVKMIYQYVHATSEVLGVIRTLAQSPPTI